MQKPSNQQLRKEQVVQETKMAMKNEEFGKLKTPELCNMCFTFFGNLKTRNLCSVCYKTVFKKEASECKDVVVDIVDKTPLLNDNSVDIKKKNRCHICNKRVGLIGFGCKCGKTFCGLHRMPEEHACSFDFKPAGRVVLEQQNPVCVADKLETRV